jgi:hypothetical protein
MVNSAATMGKVKIAEWLWRFLAAVMLFTVGWTMWIFYQLNPSPLITSAGFEAAAKARVNAKQNAQGVIAPAVDPATPAAAAPAPLPPKEPPINADRLKLSESLSTPEKK